MKRLLEVHRFRKLGWTALVAVACGAPQQRAAACKPSLPTRPAMRLA